jgi:hypothetical protein
MGHPRSLKFVPSQLASYVRQDDLREHKKEALRRAA